MKSVRLLPIVIFAAIALLAFKGIGLLTNGGYVLLGTETLQAKEAAAAAPAEGGDGGGSTIAEPTMEDHSPTIGDSAPTLPLQGDAAAASEGHGEPAAAEAGGEHAATPEASPETVMPVATACDTVGGAAAEGAHGESPAADAAAAGDHAATGNEVAAADTAPCVPDPGVNEFGDAVPMVADADGKMVPLVDGGSESAKAVNERLGERRTELDGREQELDMRLALVEAAEKRIAERTAVLEALEARINALVDQNKVAADEQFKGVVSMYESMKPKEAATILNELDMATLLRVARAMNPKKMAPIMARMDAIKAKDLTANLAIEPTEPQVSITPEDIAALPQIVGQ